MSRTSALPAHPLRCFLPFFLLLVGLLAGSLPAAARSWRIADFQDTIVIGGDGSAFVEERITLAFVGQFQGIHRSIPIEYPGPRGENYTLFLQLRDVTDDTGNALKYSSDRKGAFQDITIYVPGAIDATRVVRISYTVANAVRFFEDHDEFYWNVTGNDWPVPIDHASATVVFPDQATGSLRAQAFTGLYGYRGQEASATTNAARAAFETSNPLPMRSGLTIDIFVPQGILTAPGSLTRFGWFLRSNPIVLLPVFAFAVMFILWWYKGKDPDPGMSVAPYYEPPDGLSPAEVGTLVTDSVEPRDITSTVVDLAVKGFIKIEETKEQHLLWSNKDYLFHSLKPHSEWNSLKPHEHVMLSHLFEFEETVRLSALKNRFYVAIPVMKHDVIASLREMGMYTLDPESAPTYVAAAAILICVPFVLLQVFGWVDFSQSLLMIVVALAITIAVILLFGRKMTARSLEGARTRVKILGFEEFMNRVDAERLRTLPPDTFEKFLPYAMALGIEHRWAQSFKDILHEPPQWYAGPAGPTGMMWSPIFFTSSLHTMSTDMHTVMTMSPRSSSGGSGFGGGGFSSGGGFSGGGFGGGGGSAF